MLDKDANPNTPSFQPFVAGMQRSEDPFAGGLKRETAQNRKYRKPFWRFPGLAGGFFDVTSDESRLHSPSVTVLQESAALPTPARFALS